MGWVMSIQLESVDFRKGKLRNFPFETEKGKPHKYLKMFLIEKLLYFDSLCTLLEVKWGLFSGRLVILTERSHFNNREKIETLEIIASSYNIFRWYFLRSMNKYFSSLLSSSHSFHLWTSRVDNKRAEDAFGKLLFNRPKLKKSFPENIDEQNGSIDNRKK